MPTVDTPQFGRRDYALSIGILGALFFIFGFVTWMNGPLITYVKLAFDLDTDAKAFLVTSAFYMAYFFLALPSSWILERTGMKKGMAIGLFVMAIGSFLFATFATRRDYPVCLLGLFIIGSGLSLLQTASNPYVSILGPHESAARRISIMGICNKLAGFLAPIVLGIWVLKNVDAAEAQIAQAADSATRTQLLDQFASLVYYPYLGICALLVALAVGVALSPLPEIKASEFNAAAAGRKENSLFQFPHLWLGALCIFVYVGAEVIAGDAIGTYARSFGIQNDIAKFLTSATLIAMVVGYCIGLAVIPKIISQQTGLAISAVLGSILTVLAYVTHGFVSVAFVAALGLANALMWPAIFPLAIHGLGRLTEKGSALLIMGIAGGAVFPRLFATLKADYDFQLVFLALMLPSYLYILFYGIKGHKIGMRT